MAVRAEATQQVAAPGTSQSYKYASGMCEREALHLVLNVINPTTGPPQKLIISQAAPTSLLSVQLIEPLQRHLPPQSQCNPKQPFSFRRVDLMRMPSGFEFRRNASKHLILIRPRPAPCPARPAPGRCAHPRRQGVPARRRS